MRFRTSRREAQQARPYAYSINLRKTSTSFLYRLEMSGFGLEALGMNLRGMST